jgi:hypothetical protein
MAGSHSNPQQPSCEHKHTPSTAWKSDLQTKNSRNNACAVSHVIDNISNRQRVADDFQCVARLICQLTNSASTSVEVPSFQNTQHARSGYHAHTKSQALLASYTPKSSPLHTAVHRERSCVHVQPSASRYCHRADGHNARKQSIMRAAQDSSCEAVQGKLSPLAAHARASSDCCCHACRKHTNELHRCLLSIPGLPVAMQMACTVCRVGAFLLPTPIPVPLPPTAQPLTDVTAQLDQTCVSACSQSHGLNTQGHLSARLDGWLSATRSESSWAMPAQRLSMCRQHHALHSKCCSSASLTWKTQANASMRIAMLMKPIQP